MRMLFSQRSSSDQPESWNVSQTHQVARVSRLTKYATVPEALFNHLVATSQPRSDGPSEVWMRRRNEVTHEDRTRSNDDGKEAKRQREEMLSRAKLSRR